MYLLDLITITKDDTCGAIATLESTRRLRDAGYVRQIFVDSSSALAAGELKVCIEKEREIAYLWQEPSGISAAFNLGINHSTANWLLFLNGGDTIHPQISPEWLRYLLENSSADIIIGQIELMQSGTVLRHPPMWQMWPPVQSWVPHPATIMLRSLFDKYGLFDNKLKISMDFDLWLRMMAQDIIVDTLSIPLTLYDEQGISSTQTSLAASEGYATVKRHLTNLFKIWLHNGIGICRAMYYYRKLSKRSR